VGFSCNNHLRNLSNTRFNKVVKESSSFFVIPFDATGGLDNELVRTEQYS